jgi:hypothetical protein
MSEMNEQHENSPMIDSRQLDRLVDGELSAADRRQLIETLERQPDGWRHCACAFLESQEIGATLNDLAAGAAVPQTLAATRRGAEIGSRAKDVRHAPRSLRVSWVAVTAACLSLGFFVGRSTEQQGATSLDQSPLLVTDERNERDGQSPSSPINDLAENTAAVDRDSQFVGGGRYSAVPTEIERILDRVGHRVERRHVYMPVVSQDGRRVVIPVEQVDLVPVGWETY